MTLSEMLQKYAEKFGFNSKQLAQASGLSSGAISKYRSGSRVPNADSNSLVRLATGLCFLAQEQGMVLEHSVVLNELNQAVSGGVVIPFSQISANLNALLSLLKMSNAELARKINYDPSSISRFLSGRSIPGDVRKFIQDVASCLANQVQETQLPALAELLGCREEDISSTSTLHTRIIKWLASNMSAPPSKDISSFLEKLDDFDLNHFIRAIHFDDIRLPTAAFTLPTRKYYRGIAAFKESELDFIRAVVLSKSMEDVIIFSDMPIAELGRDTEWSKKYMFGMAMLLKKGLKVHFIHDVHRPFEELMLGLEGNIPMYMTGQISPYYLEKPQNEIFYHLEKSAGGVAMSGEAMTHSYAKGRYLLTKSKEEVQYYRERARRLLRCAKPLMDIYRSDQREEYLLHLHELWQNGSRRMIFTSLPLFTISEELLCAMLHRSEISQEEKEQILKFRLEYRTAMTRLLQTENISLEIPDLTEENFAEATLTLSLSQLFYEKEIAYTYAEYQEHLAQTKAFADSCKNCILKAEPNQTFRNISFSVIYGKCVIVSKNSRPAIHFVIYHPRLVYAFEHFVPPMREKKMDSCEPEKE